MKDLKAISKVEFESNLKSMETKPYLVIIAKNEEEQKDLEKENITALTDFNQKEILKDLSIVFILEDIHKWHSSLKGFLYPFYIQNIEELNEALFDRNRIYLIVD